MTANFEPDLINLEFCDISTKEIKILIITHNRSLIEKNSIYFLMFRRKFDS